MAAVSRRLTAGGMSEATSWAARGDTVACHFYTRHGGQVVAERQQAVSHELTLDYAYAWTNLSTLERPRGSTPS
jgi:hypothetical protein